MEVKNERQCRVLYAGKNSRIINILQSYFNLPDLEVLFFPDAASSVPLILGGGIDVLFIDEFIQDLSFTDVIRKLHSEGSVPIYAVITKNHVLSVADKAAAEPASVFSEDEDFLSDKMLTVINSSSQRTDLFRQFKIILELWDKDRDKFYFLSENIPFLVWIIDSETMRYTYCNSAFKNVLGRSTEQMLSFTREFLNEFPSGRIVYGYLLEDNARCDAGMSEFPLRYYETEFGVKEGVHGWLENASKYVSGGSGTWCVLGISRDISKKHYGRKSAIERSSRFKEIIGSMPVPICLVMNTTLVFMNNAAIRMFELSSQDEMIGRSALDFVRKDYHDLVRQRVGKLREKGTVLPAAEQVWISARGKEITVEMSSTVINIDNQPFILLSAINISERKQAEKQSSEKSALIEGLYRLAPNAMGIISNRRLIEANNRLYEMTGYSPDELVGNTLNILHESYFEFLNVAKGAERLTDEGVVIEMESRYNRKDGAVLDVNIRRTLTPSLGENTIVFCVMDITERKKIERDLQLREAELSILFEESPICMILINSNFDICRANRAAREFAEQRGAEGISSHVGAFLSCQNARGKNCDEICCGCELFSILDETHKTGKSISRREINICVIRENKPIRKALIVSSSIVNINNEAMALLCISDISRQKRLEERLHQVQKLEAMGQLAGGAAHDFNNILSALMLHLSILIGDTDHGSKMHEELEELKRNVERGTGMTRKLLLLGRQETTRDEVIDIDSLISEMIKMLRHIIDSRIIITHISGELPIRITADKVMIEQVIMNLCINARDAMPDGGSLDIITDIVSSEKILNIDLADFKGYYAKILIKDTGCGFNEETKAQIFEPFFSTKPSGEGTGLGLSIVFGIVEKYKGWINVDSTPGVGTEISVFLPLENKV